MKRVLASIRRWWQYNFGHVFLTSPSHPGTCWRFRARRGRVALVWCSTPFVCVLRGDGAVVNSDNPTMSGYGKQYGDYTWSFEPTGAYSDGGFWR